jgi:hypothetical protein
VIRFRDHAAQTGKLRAIRWHEQRVTGAPTNCKRSLFGFNADLRHYPGRGEGEAL